MSSKELILSTRLPISQRQFPMKDNTCGTGLLLSIKPAELMSQESNSDSSLEATKNSNTPYTLNAKKRL